MSERFAVVERLAAAGVKQVNVALVVLVPDGDGVAAERDCHGVQRLWPHSLNKIDYFFLARKTALFCN